MSDWEGMGYLDNVLVQEFANFLIDIAIEKIQVYLLYELKDVWGVGPVFSQ